MTIDISTILQGAFGLGMSLLLYFIKSTMARVEKSINDLRDTQTTIKLMQVQLNKIEDDVKDAGRMAMEIQALVGKIAIIERNLETCFRHIDEVRNYQKDRIEIDEKNQDLLRKRSHFFQNKLMVLKAAIEKQGNFHFSDNWSMP